MKFQEKPDWVRSHDGEAEQAASLSGETIGLGAGLELQFSTEAGVLRVDAVISAPLSHIQLRWNQSMPAGLLYLGDHWERAYGDLEWRSLVPHRVLPWYFHASDRRRTHGVGVRTGGPVFAFWQVDPEGVSLYLDLRNGALPLQPKGERKLRLAEIVVREGHEDESVFAACQAFCRQLCPSPRLPAEPVYGSNNWYSCYGETSQEEVLAHTDLLLELCPEGGNRPYMVIDDGWKADFGIYDRSNEKFPDMGALAEEIRRRGAKPGLWIRPLEAASTVDARLLLPDERMERDPMWPYPPCIDPTIPENFQYVRDMVKRVHDWGYELIKHDFTTYDLTGHWGYQMFGHITRGDWHFHDRTKTTAEIILELYQAIREEAKEACIIGCNTVSHLSAGLFEIQRTGDDTSGKHWERSRVMGINTLAFRMPQHGTFYAADADCVGLTQVVDWGLNARFMDVLSRSGTPYFVSFESEAIGAEQRKVLEETFARSALPQAPSEPLDWFETTCPTRWEAGGLEYSYAWSETCGIEMLPADSFNRLMRAHYLM